MHPQDDEFLVGRPIQAPQAPAASRFSGNTESAADRSSQEEEPFVSASSEAREGEGPGRPSQLPVQISRLTEQDLARLRALEKKQAQEEARQLEEMLAEETAIVRLPAFLSHPLVFAAVLGLAALLGLFVFNQITSTLTALSNQPEWVRYLGCAGLALLGAIVLYAVGRFLFFYFRLRPNRPIPVHVLQELAKRSRLRQLVREKKQEAREQLETYLRSYPLSKIRDRRALLARGLEEDTLKGMDRAQADLLNPDHFANYDAWFVDFSTRFQAPLDALGQQRVTYYARRVALLTAVSPNALLDTVITAYCGFRMITELCEIYQLRASQLGTAVLLCWVFFNAYLAGQLNELESMTEAGIEEMLGESGLDMGSMAAGAMTAKVLGKLGARVASGTLNYLLLRRLGRYALRLLRPVSNV